MKLEELFEIAADLGRDRHGIVTAADLRVAGADLDTVALALRTHWQAPVRGVYVLHRDPLSDAELGHVGVAHAGPGAVVTGVLAARVHGLRWLPEVPGVMVLVGRDVQRQDSHGLVTVRRSSRLDEVPTRSWNGLGVAAAPQVVADACRQVLVHRAREWGVMTRARRALFEEICLREVRGIVLGAVADQHCAPEEVLAVIDVGPRNGTKLIRRACVDAERGAASPPEAELVDGLLPHNVPFLCNAELWDGDRLVAVVDVLLLATGVGGELDSKEAHGASELLDLTLLRHGRVERYGAKLLHVTPSRYRAQPAAFHHDLFVEVRDRQARGLGHPASLRVTPRGPVLCGTGHARPYPVPAWALDAARSGTLPDDLLRAS